MFHLICFFAVCFCSVLHQSPNARPILKLLVEGGKQWGHRPWSAGGMSGGAEQTDILSVLSLVKERWKVVSDAVFDNNANSVCPVTACPWFHLLLLPSWPPNCDSLFVKQCFPLYFTISPVAWTVCVFVHIVLLQGKLKIARTAICDGAVFFLHYSQAMWQCCPRGPMFPAAVPAWMCAMWRSYSLLVTSCLLESPVT